jgi:hypothetical protein
MSWQTVPTSVHCVDLQVHDAVLPLVAHVWCEPHVAVVSHSGHPASVSQVSTPPDEHRAVPRVHVSAQTGPLSTPESRGACPPSVASAPSAASIIGSTTSAPGPSIGSGASGASMAS